jgi:hypothetical protein
MPFDIGFNFRDTSVFVTDPSYAVPVLAQAYPHTYTNVNGDSIVAGWTTSIFSADRSTGVDVRLAGINFGGNTLVSFRIDLASGTGPGAGSYTLDMAVGDQASFHTYDAVNVKDNTTTLVTFSGTPGGTNHYFDATGADRAPGSGSWDLVRATTNITFATTTCFFEMVSASDNPTLAHFRLTLVPSGPVTGRLRGEPMGRVV